MPVIADVKAARREPQFDQVGIPELFIVAVAFAVQQESMGAVFG